MIFTHSRALPFTLAYGLCSCGMAGLAAAQANGAQQPSALQVASAYPYATIIEEHQDKIQSLLDEDRHYYNCGNEPLCGAGAETVSLPLRPGR
jgi:hypothetical protein